MGWNEFKEEFSNKGCLEKVVKYFLLIVNVIFEITGGALIGIGIRIIFTVQRSGIDALSLPIIFVVAGCLIIIISSVGYAGAKKGNLDQLRGYVCLLIITFVVNVICIAVAFMMGGRAFGVPHVSEYKEVFDKYHLDSNATAVVDKLQRALFCCGYNGPELLVLQNGTYPISCCLAEKVECKIPFLHRCKTEIAQVIYPMSVIAKVVFYTLPVLEFLCIIGAFFLIVVSQRKVLVVQQLTNDYSDL